MNYYIQGDAANADRIKAALEKLGYDTTGWRCNVSDAIYYTTNERKVDIACNKFFINLIKTHPDYKELELPVEPNFKIGDWVVFNNNHNSIYQISEIKDFYYTLTHTYGGSIPLSFSEVEFIRPWTIQDAKDGDVIAFNDSPDVNLPLRWIGIYKQPRVVSNKSYWFHCIITPDCMFRGYDSWWVSNVHPATKEQRDLLFKKMKEAGYEWDADKKELLKIKHYAIANFRPFDKVLCRNCNNDRWRAEYFSHLSKNGKSFVAIGYTWCQCIPYDGNEHLLGTTDPCDEQYINW